MTVFHEARPPASFIMEEEELSYCRDEVTVIASMTIKAGNLLKANSTNVELWTIGAAATGIAIYPVTTAAGETKKVAALVRGPAVVNEKLIRWLAFTVGAPTKVGTGDGTLTRASPAFSAEAKVGTYKVKCVTAASNGGVFDVIDPDGVREGQATVGVAYTGSVKFTIADGSADFIVGDYFTLAVTVDNATPKAALLALGIRCR